MQLKKRKTAIFWGRLFFEAATAACAGRARCNKHGSLAGFPKCSANFTAVGNTH